MAQDDPVILSDEIKRAGDTRWLRRNEVTLPLSGGAGVSDGDKGDIIVSGSGATWMLDPEVMQRILTMISFRG